jgi:hypothetical protein
MTAAHQNQMEALRGSFQPLDFSDTLPAMVKKLGAFTVPRNVHLAPIELSLEALGQGLMDSIRAGEAHPGLSMTVTTEALAAFTALLLPD